MYAFIKYKTDEFYIVENINLVEEINFQSKICGVAIYRSHLSTEKLPKYLEFSLYSSAKFADTLEELLNDAFIEML